MNETPYALWVPMLKSLPSDELDKAYKHRGVISTQERDQEGETAIQEAMDISWFLSKGFFNWNHKPGPGNLVGEPTGARLTTLGDIPGYSLRPDQTGDEPCFYVEGVLYKGLTAADEIWNLMTALSDPDAGYRRRLGYSVEGGIVARRGPILAKSFVRHCAITHEPVNASTLALLAKGWGYAEEPSEADCQSFECLTSFRKALAPPAMPSDGVAAMAALALGLVACEAGCHDGRRFFKGRDGMRDHLTHCTGWTETDATDYILALASALESTQRNV